MKKLYTTLGIFFTLSSITIAIYASDNQVEKYQSQYDSIVQDLSPLYQDLTILQNKIKYHEDRLQHIQCLLAIAKKEKGLEVSEDSQYCFTKLP